MNEQDKRNKQDSKQKNDGNSNKNSRIIPSKPYDSFIRAAMQHKAVAKAFFIQELPNKLSKSLDYSTLTPLNTSYIDSQLQSSFSDICFECHYDTNYLNEKGIEGQHQAKIIMLVEHQSSPGKLMPFRMFHYLLNALHKEILKHGESAFNQGLPAIYPLIYYHGEQSRYPYPLNFSDCFLIRQTS